MSKKISQLTTTEIIGDEDQLAIVSGGSTKVIRFKAVLKTLNRELLGIDKVDNTPDLEKPISTAVAGALNGKASVRHTHTAGELEGIAELVEDEVVAVLNKNAGVTLSDNEW